MARFNVAARRALDASLPERARFVALLWAIDSYARLTGESFHGTFGRLGAHLGFDWSSKPSSAQIAATAELLQRERDSFLRADRRLAAERRDAKRASRQRQPTTAQLWDLYFGPWLSYHRRETPMELSFPDRIWNRAALEGGGQHAEAGDRALAVLLRAHGYIMNGGVHHGLECLAPHELTAAKEGYSFFGFEAVARLLEVAASLEEDEADAQYAAIIADDSVIDRTFADVVARAPHAFASFD